MNKFILKWRFSKIVLWISLIIVIVLPLLAISWIMFRFDLPFIHGGDKLIGRLLIGTWWVFITIFIFGWRIRSHEKNG